MSAAFVYSPLRTPFGRFAGALAGIQSDDLAATVLSALLKRPRFAQLGDVRAASSTKRLVAGDIPRLAGR